MGKDKLTYHQYDTIEQRFLREVMDIIQTRPFWWYLFINKILGSPLITYFKDTTVIISLNDLSYHNTEIVFEIIRKLLKVRAATKVIKKKEFIIVHLYSPVIVDYLKSRDKWKIIPVYFLIRNHFPDFRCYFDVRFQSDSEEVLINLLLLRNLRGKETFWITVDKPSEKAYPRVRKMQIMLGEHCRIKPQKHYDVFQISLDTQEMTEVLNSYFQSLATIEKLCYN